MVNKSKLKPETLSMLRQLADLFKIEIERGEYMLFDVTTTEAKSEGGLIPDGKYLAFIDKVELKKTKDETGKYLAVMWRLVEPPFKNRTVFHNYNFQSMSEKAQEIAMKDLKTLFVAAGRTEFKITKPEEMLGLVCEIQVKTKVDSFGEKNIVTNYYKTKKDVAALAQPSATAVAAKPKSQARVPGL